MSTINTNWKGIAIKHGIYLMLGLIGFFLLMLATGLAHVYWLRVLNAFILYFIVQAAIKNFKSRSRASYYEDFLDFFRVGMITGIIGIIGFVVFIALYLDVINPAFMEEVRTIEKLSPYLTPITAAGIVMIEGIGSTFICCYLAIQYQKRSTVETPIDPNASKEKMKQKAKVDSRNS